MSLYEPVYTDALKDVVGNEPVLDEFDIFYEASYYGTSQDDYVTGSLLSKRSSNGKIILDIGDRRKAFSKFYAESAPPLDTTYGGKSVANNPSLSYRLRPNYTRVSTTSYRLSQAFDSNERYYDSCLPDLNTCFKADGCAPWKMTFTDSYQLSPKNNFDFDGRIANLVFNYETKDRSSEGFDVDFTVNNTWTWAYPYESRYQPSKRNISVSEALNLENITKSAEISLIKPEQIYPRNNEFWESSGDESFKIESLATIGGISPISFRSILPGRLSGEKFEFSGRNSFRQTCQNSYSGSNGYRNIIPTSYSMPNLDGEYGYSLLIPSEINLSVLTPSHSELLTSSMYLGDNVKFLFGFGDLNNMTYTRRKEFTGSTSGLNDLSWTVTESFESNSDGDPSTSVPTFDNGTLRINWNTGGYANSNRWKVAEFQGYTGTGDYIFSGPAAVPPYSTGVTWLNDILSPYGEKIIYSNTTSDLGGDMDPGGDVSYMHVDVTSSCPWTVSFRFAIVSDGVGDYLAVSIKNSDVEYFFLDTKDETAPDNFFYVSEDGSNGYPVTLSPLPGIEHVPPGSPPSRSGGIYDWGETGCKDGGLGPYYFTGSNSYPIPSGEYRITFQYVFGGASGTPTVSFAAMDVFRIKTYDESFFPIDETSIIGGNNYPEFRIINSDQRPNDSYTPPSGWVPSGATEFEDAMRDLTSDIYAGVNYGVSPVIRGWKYGLVNGFPMHTKTIFRRGRYGQFRDMLEQRQYTKFINVGVSPVDYDAITENNYNKELSSNLSVQQSYNPTVTDASVDVRFVRAVARVNERGIGAIVSEEVRPEETFSQNLSVSVTSSLPYFDGISRHRSKEDVDSVRRRSFVDTASAVVNASDSQLGL